VRDLDPGHREAREFAEAIHAQFPGKMLAYNCSPSFNWSRSSTTPPSPKFQRELGAMGYKFQFVTLAGFHALNHGMFELARGYRTRDGGLRRVCRKPSSRPRGRLHGHEHQREVGTGYFRRGDAGSSRTEAAPPWRSEGSTETAQFRTR
jgi:isocitrate lyase